MIPKTEKCANCGNQYGIVWSEGAFFCEKCAELFSTCRMCENSFYCGFVNDPDESPTHITRTIKQQTPMGFIQKTQSVPNPERVAKFCNEEKCQCFGEFEGEKFCQREFFMCKNYKERNFRELYDSESC